MSDIVLTKTQQAAVFDEQFDESVTDVAALILAGRKQLRLKARDRMLGMGFEQFGSALFNRGMGDLFDDLDEELADAVVYRIAARWMMQSKGRQNVVGE